MNTIVWSSDQPDVVLTNDWTAEGMPMPKIRNPRASAPWAEVHRTKGTRHRVTRTVDHRVAARAKARKIAVILAERSAS